MPIVALAQPVVNPLSACILDDQDRNRRPYFAGTILDFHPDYLTRSIGQSEVLHPVRVYLKETANGWLVGEETCIVGHEVDINNRHKIHLIANAETVFDDCTARLSTINYRKHRSKNREIILIRIERDGCVPPGVEHGVGQSITDECNEGSCFNAGAADRSTSLPSNIVGVERGRRIGGQSRGHKDTVSHQEYFAFIVRAESSNERVSGEHNGFGASLAKKGYHQGRRRGTVRKKSKKDGRFEQPRYYRTPPGLALTTFDPKTGNILAQGIEDLDVSYDGKQWFHAFGAQCAKNEQRFYLHFKERP